MEVALVEIKKWNEIQDKFTDSFGWSRGLELMLKTASDIKKDKFVYELSINEDNKVIKALRSAYKEELKWLEKEKVK